jgi:PAS domain S-box-containing protein
MQTKFFKFLLVSTLILVYATENKLKAQHNDSLAYYQQNLLHPQKKVAIKSYHFLIQHFENINPIKALALADSAIQLTKDSAYKTAQAQFLIHQGNIHLQMGLFDRALASFYKVILMTKDTAIETEQAEAAVNIASLYLQFGYFTESYQLIAMAIPVFDSLGNAHGKMKAYTLLGLIYSKTNDMGSSIESFQLALAIADSIKQNKNLAIIYLEMANHFMKEKNIESAAKFCHLCLKTTKEIKYPVIEGDCYKLLADLYKAKNQAIASKHYYLLALKHDFTKYKPYLRLNIYHQLSEIAVLQQNTIEQLAYLSLYSNLSDSLIHERATFQIKQFIQKINAEQQIRKDASLVRKEISNKDKKLKEQEKKIGNYAAYLGITGILALAIILYSYVLKKANKKLIFQKEEIKERNDEMRQQADEISAQAEMLSKANEELEKLSIVARKTDNAVIICNKEQEILWVNESFENFYGFTLAEFKKQLGTKLFEVSGNKEIKEYVKEAELKRDSVVYSNQYIQKNGHIIWTQTVLTPVFNMETDELDKFIAIDSDITELKEAKDFIEIQNKEITASISYASKLQKALLPLPIFANAILEKHFVLYYPKDIVSGDFYWMAQKDNKTVIAVADCTGHGIPGAFMTALSVVLLRSTIDSDKSLQPEKVLFELRKNLIKTLHQRNISGSLKDGFDISLVYLDNNSGSLDYAGANLPLTIIRNNEIIYLKPDKMPIGIFDKDDENFSKQTFKLLPNDMVYMYTDGFMDQFGGPKGKKYYRRRLMRFLQGIASQDINYQKRMLAKEFIYWKGENEQIDDVLLLGFRFE